MAHYRPAKLSDCMELAPIVRKIEQRELAVSGCSSMLTGLIASLEASHEAHTIIIDDKVAGMFGVSEYDGMGVPWLLTSDEITKIPIKFLRESRKWVRSLDYKLLVNYVLKDNQIAINWLKFLGFKFLREIELGGETFIEFVRIQDV